MHIFFKNKYTLMDYTRQQMLVLFSGKTWSRGWGWGFRIERSEGHGIHSVSTSAGSLLDISPQSI